MKKKEIRILYEDNHILAVEKPVNVGSQEDETGDPDMLTLLKDYLKEKYQKPGNVYLGLVHRLDRPVGGAMVFAKTSKAASRLSEQIRQREFKKTYLAVIHGIPSVSKGSLRHFLYKDTKANRVSVVPKEHKDAKEALLEYEVLESSGGMSLLSICLHTGRPHQIRVQFSAIGHPLFGDQKYGESFNKKGQQIALWSREIVICHPTKQEPVKFECNPPNEFPWNIFSKLY